MKNFRKDNGITLIALVVTIVVLLILAGITISTLFGENGIINAARKAEQDTKQGEVDTDEKLQNIEDQMHGQLGIDTSSLAKLISANSFVTAEQGNQIVSDKTGKSMIVPVGFKIAEDSATEIDKGVVIEDKIGNQYVWVSVSTDAEFNAMFGSTGSGNNINYFGKLYNFTTTGKGSPMQSTIGSTSGYREPDIVTSYDGTHANYTTAIGNKTADQFKNEMQTKFNDMAKSVKQYKGFYIGRYELSGLSDSNPTTTIPKVKKGVNPSYSVNWYNMYREIQNIETYANSGVQSDVKTNMIWGCQWDRTLDWIATTDTKIGYAGLKNSTSWGNYSDSTFKYTTTSGTTTTTLTKAKDTSTRIPTGSTEYTKVNNIYDLAGNLYEWTMEANSTSLRVSRGGHYDGSGSGRPASDRGYNDPYGSKSGSLGSRPTLYVLSNI